MWQILSAHLWLRFPFRHPLDVTVSTTIMNTERHDITYKCTWRHNDGADIFLLIWFLKTSMQNDPNETKLHNKYDYECIRNTLTLIQYFPSKYVLAINLPWSVLKSKQHMYVEFFFWWKIFLVKSVFILLKKYPGPAFKQKIYHG